MSLKIISWNVLGHKHTHHNYHHHRNGLGNVETEQQKNIRYTKNTIALKKINPDIVLLQEFSGYEIDMSEYNNTLNEINKEEPGCYIFYKHKKVQLLWSKSYDIGYNKNATIAEFLDIIADKKFVLISFHLVGGKDSDTYQIDQLKILNNIVLNFLNQIIIIGGDCNQKNIDFLNNNSNFTFMELNDNTALVQNMKVPGKIDYFGFNEIGKFYFRYDGVYIQPTINPWSYRCAIGSDHVPLIGTLQL
jgi:exonuclease III